MIPLDPPSLIEAPDLLETERLLLRQFLETDVDLYARICADPEAMRYIGDGSTLTREQTWRSVAAALGHWVLRGYGMYAVEEKSTGTFIGRIGLSNPEGWPGLEAGWLLGRPHWGHGYATEGAKAVICASTGNTAASAAAYAARAGITCAVIVPEGRIAQGKMAQTLVHGARVIELRGNFDQALVLVRELTDTHPIVLVNSVNEFRVEGQKTAAFEIHEALEGSLEALCIPVGNAGNITSYWRGFRELGAAPRMLGFQAEGAAPLVLGRVVEHPETVASAIRIGNPVRWEDAMAAATDSRGAIRAVSDAEILAAFRLLASKEGMFCEPASAASVAGLLKYGSEGAEQVVCVLTGRGLKDPETAIANNDGRVIPCAAEIGPIEEAVLGDP